MAPVTSQRFPDPTAALFDERLRSAVATRELRVLAVDIDLTDSAIVALERTLGVPVIALDQRLIAAIDVEARHLEVDPAAIRETDAAGPADPHWGYLCEIAAGAAERVASELLPPEQPLVLTQLGLLARYDLRAFLRRLVTASRDEASAAIVLLVPCDEAHPFLIQHTLAIPVHPGERERIPRSWIHHVAPSPT